VTLGAFGSRAFSDPSGLFSDDRELISEKNPVISFKALFPNTNIEGQQQFARDSPFHRLARIGELTNSP
jgi:hypothetical protein